jgi:hypothetical protein
MDRTQIAPEMLKRAVADVLREFDGTVVDFNNAVQLDQLALGIEEKVRQRVGNLCRNVATYLAWEELEMIRVEVVCNETTAYTYVPVYAVLRTAELDVNDVDVDMDEVERGG